MRGTDQVAKSKAGKVYIIVVNFNGSEDTISCLESLDELKFENWQVLIVDNRSTDDSVARLREWLTEKCGRTAISQRSETIQLGPQSGDSQVSIHGRDIPEAKQARWPYVLIENEWNCGFAAGNNAAIRYALERQDGDYFWLLNNDTIVDSRALGELVAVFEPDEAASVGIGMCGSLLLDFENRDRIQAFGGATINRLFGVTRNCLKGLSAGSDTVSQENSVPDYISGCSLLVKSETIDKIGLLNETYFLYWEDAEWSFRCKQHGLSLAVAPKSRIWHRRGSTSRRYPVVGFYNTRNSLRFFRDYLPSYLLFCIVFKPVVVLAITAKHRNFAFFWESMRGYIEFFREVVGTSVQRRQRAIDKD